MLCKHDPMRSLKWTHSHLLNRELHPFRRITDSQWAVGETPNQTLEYTYLFQLVNRCKMADI